MYGFRVCHAGSGRGAKFHIFEIPRRFSDTLGAKFHNVSQSFAKFHWTMLEHGPKFRC